MTSEVLTKLWKYKKQLDAFLKRNEDDKVLIMLQKVNKLNVTIEMIKETSIGKLVNSITSKEELGIGKKAAGLVDKWRRLIEEVVDKKYKSDEDSSPRQKPRVEVSTKQTPQNPKKTESPEKSHLKRKSEAPEERPKPPKQSRTSNKSVIPTETKEPLPEESNGGSFLSAINNKISKPKKSSAAKSNPEIKSKPSKSPTPEPEEASSDEVEDSLSHESPQRPEMNGLEYPDEVFEHLENISAMFEDRKKAQATKVVEQDNLGGRTYAVPSLFCGKKVETPKNIPTFIEKFQHLLYDNIENSEFIGEVPYEILEPVLKKLNPAQLERFEYFNPLVVQKSDDIWKMHVLRKYPESKPDEFGSWREVYLDSRDAMKAKFEQCLQKFSTNVAKMKQEEHKTKFFDPCTARVGKRSSRDVFGRNGATSTGMGAGFRGKAFPQKAPLMQKTLKMMKSGSRR